MKKAEYPQRTCREPMFSDLGVGHNCDLPHLHRGPCASLSIARSVTARDAWEAANPDDAEKSRDGGDIIL
jgi:hypothetical protein